MTRTTSEDGEGDSRVRVLRDERALAQAVIHDPLASPAARQQARDTAVAVHTALDELRES